MTPASPPLSARQSAWLLAAAFGASLPLAPHLPGWLVAAVLVAYVWRGGLLLQRRPLPPRWLLVLAVIAVTVGVYLEYRTVLGQYPGIAMLSLFLALKLLEAKTRRDGHAIVFLAYFVAMAGLLHAQSIGHGAALLAAVAIATATLAVLTDDRPAPAAQLRLAARMLAQATPFLLVFFILFPRIDAPLWGLPRDAHSARTGLSDSMTPGSIGDLSLSDAVAFRAAFSGPLPARDRLYWRGPVLTYFDGRTWRAPTRYRAAPTPPYTAPDEGIDYAITLEAHRQHWLFLLELPTRLPDIGLMAEDYLTLAREPVTQRTRYHGRSLPQLRIGGNLPRHQLDAALQLPAGTNPRIRAVAAEWRHSHGDLPQSAARIVDAAVAFFRARQLTYTLTPQVLNANSVDGFLFDTRQGFCEHFASAFVFALRAAGVPARVVTGYQGGELNPIDGNLVVRQYDAHAWAEAWIPPLGWTRIDPTAVSAPARIEGNLAAAVPAGDPLPFLMRLDTAWLRDLRYRWDAVSNTWNQWVLGYTPQRQRDLLSQLGMPSPDWRGMTVAMSLLAGIGIAALTAWALLQRRREDPAQTQWRRLTRRLARRGLAPHMGETAGDFARRSAARRPDIAAELAAIAECYALVRYGGRHELIDDLRRRIAAFKP